MSIIDRFKSAPHREEIQDSAVVKKQYKYWRMRTFYAMYIGYAFYYFTRKSFTYAMPEMQYELGLGKFELGLLASILSLSYGASKFISGVLGDKSNPRYFMSVGLILTGIFNLCFGMSSVFWAFAVFWGCNGLFQGWGWPGCAKLLTHWYSQTERGRWWSVWNTSHNLGGALIPFLAAACIYFFDWRYVMYVPGFVCILGGFFLMNRLRDTPQSLGLPSIEKYRNDYPNGEIREEKELTAKEILWDYVLCNKYIWVLALANLFVYVIRTGIDIWSMFYLIEVKNYSSWEAGFCVSSFEIGGFVGSLAAGWSSDLLFKGKRNPVNVLFTIGLLFLIFAFKFLNFHWSCDVAFLFLFGFFIFGPQMLIGMVAAELSHKKASATASGFTGCFGYVGAALAGGPLGAITKNWGWDSYLVSLFVCGMVCVLMLLPLWSIKTNTQKREEEVLPQEAPSTPG